MPNPLWIGYEVEKLNPGYAVVEVRTVESGDCKHTERRRISPHKTLRGAELAMSRREKADAAGPEA